MTAGQVRANAWLAGDDRVVDSGADTRLCGGLRAGDELMGVFINSFTTAATAPEQRAGFVAATGAVHNFAKFTAPAAFGALTIALPLAPAFYLSGLTIASMTRSRHLCNVHAQVLTPGV